MIDTWSEGKHGGDISEDLQNTTVRHTGEECALWQTSRTCERWVFLLEKLTASTTTKCKRRGLERRQGAGVLFIKDKTRHLLLSPPYIQSKLQGFLNPIYSAMDAGGMMVLKSFRFPKRPGNFVRPRISVAHVTPFLSPFLGEYHSKQVSPVAWSCSYFGMYCSLV